MSKAVGRTGAATIASVAVEQHYPEAERIITDELAGRILPAGMAAFARLMKYKSLREWIIRSSERDIPGAWAGILGRKRFIDDALVAAADEMEAVVNIGAGFDTRVYRLEKLNRLAVWETDSPGNIAAKKKRLVKALGALPPNVRLVPMDLNKEAVGDALKACGFLQALKTFYIIEGVSQYLSQGGIEGLFSYLSTSAPGSRLALTYVLKDFIEGRELYGWRKGFEKYVVRERMWTWGMNRQDWPDFLRQYGWEPLMDIGGDYLAEHYVRPTGRAFEEIPVERTLVAIRPGGSAGGSGTGRVAI